VILALTDAEQRIAVNNGATADPPHGHCPAFQNAGRVPMSATARRCIRICDRKMPIDVVPHVAAVEDVAPNGYAIDRATVRQKKTGRPVKFELTDQTRQAVDDYLKAAHKKPGEFLFTGRRGMGRCMTTRQYARLISEWLASSRRKQGRGFRQRRIVRHVRRR
jgi:hypothetical protein